MLYKGGAKPPAHSFSIFGWNLQGPGAEDSFRWVRISETFCIVKRTSTRGSPSNWKSSRGIGPSPSLTKTCWNDWLMAFPVSRLVTVRDPFGQVTLETSSLILVWLLR